MLTEQVTSALRKRSQLPQALQGRPLLPLLLALVCGELLACWITPAVGTALCIAVLAAIAAVLLCCFLPGRRWRPMLLAFAGLGFFLCAGELAAVSAWPLANGDYGVVEGTVRSSTLADEDGRYQLQLKPTQLDGQPLACGDILVYGEGDPPRSGSRVRIYGQSFTPTENHNPYAFSYSEYLRHHGIAAQFSAYYGGTVEILRPGPTISPAALGAWLRSCLNTAAQTLSAHQRGLIFGAYLGETEGISAEAEQAMAVSGLTHVFSVSGLHVSYIVMLSLLLAGKGFHRRKLRFGMTVSLLLLYLCLAGLAAPILRAAIMSLILLLADLLLEEQEPISSLSLAAIVCLLIRPLWLFDAGCQLSFAAIWGMMVLTPLFRRAWGGWNNRAATLFAAGCAACLATWPLICHYFYYAAWLGWLLTPAALPLVGIAVALCFIATPLAVLLPAAAGWLLQMAAFAMQLVASMASFLTRLPFAASYSGILPLWAVIIFFLALLLLPSLVRRLGQRVFLPLLAVLLILSVCLPHLVNKPRALPEGAPALAEIVFLDVGQGDAALVTTSDGLTMLIDGGGKASAPGSVGEYVLLPYLQSRGIRHIDVVVNSHPDLDHTDGLLSVLNAMPVDTLLYANVFTDDEIQQQLLAAATENGSVCRAVMAGDCFQFGSHLRLEVLGPAAQASGDENDDSLLLRLSCGEVDVLFTGDASGSVLAAAAGRYDLSADIVKLPHHGSRSGYDEEFYRATAAQAVVVSVGAANSYGHPAAEVIEYWQEAAAVYRTDEMGAICIRTDGYDFAVETETEPAA